MYSRVEKVYRWYTNLAFMPAARSSAACCSYSACARGQSPACGLIIQLMALWMASRCGPHVVRSPRREAARAAPAPPASRPRAVPGVTSRH